MGTLLSPQDFAGGITAAPPAGAVRLGGRTLGGGDFLGIRAAQGIERLIMPHLGRTAFVGWLGTGTTALAVFGSAAPTVSGGTTRATTAVTMATRAKRTGFVSTATAGALSSCFGGNTFVGIGDGAGLGGFCAIFRFTISDPATVAGARMFVGLSSTSVAPTNVEPSTLLNQIGVAQLSGSTNLQIVFGGSTAQNAIDLGANFPAAGGTANLYELMLFSDPNDVAKVGYRVERLNTGNVVEGVLANTVPGITLPSSSTMMTMRMWRSNNATVLAVGLDVVSAVTVWDF